MYAIYWAVAAAVMVSGTRVVVVGVALLFCASVACILLVCHERSDTSPPGNNGREQSSNSAWALALALVVVVVVVVLAAGAAQA